ncbi:helix-turn-helix transcriptional regulator [Salmonella enterica]|uniref:helix-turn-helix transcriptional regulator n=1 Tax=Salmonella enterica TaxID=28901 RepID=UPI00111A5B65|nr:helix-turn-helix transcriptional regulator [Salmonella enterica]ECC7842292.1 helix-turn-helix transcriptional regulator [Salmonella enterica]EHE5994073.1 helix-turn-helix transcriptional regulator [Salmonella enterica]EHO4423701.1 helix-turn-helix transcriptional regulator [Salmonella enterica]EMD3032070.1 helix-turn-helix transcriptional regulator [Salmonella enterica]EMD4144133.1 helix-turn-helix transcriptional regulator [Salmonella enterica]
MSNTIEQKMKKIRLAEGMTQKQLSELTGLSLGTIKNYESGQNTVGLYVVQAILVQKPFRKYTMWVIHDTPDAEPVQVAPVTDPTRKRAG